MANIAAKIATLLPSKGTEGNNLQLRSSPYGDASVIQALPAALTAALEGSLFVCRVAPAVGGTGVANGIQVTFSDTANVSGVLTNGEAASGKTYLPMYLRGRLTAAGASTTSAEIQVQVDNSNRFSSGGTALTTSINNVNAAAGAPASLASVVVGAVTAAAAGTRKRVIGSALVKVAAAPCWLVNDVILVTFGAPGQFIHTANAVASDTAAPVVTAHVPMPACAVPAGGSMVWQLANIANAVTPPSIEWELAWIER